MRDIVRRNDPRNFGRGAGVKRVSNRKKVESGGAKVSLRNILRLLFVVMMMTLTAAATHASYEAAAQKQLFNVKKIVVEGCDTVPETRIETFMGNVMGENIFLLDIKVIGERIESDPWIKSVSIRRDLPGRLTVSIVERRPAVIVKNSRTFIVDVEGAVLSEIDSTESWGLPVVSGMSDKDWKGSVGDFMDISLLKPVFMAMRQLSGYSLLGRGRLAGVDISDINKLRLAFENLETVVLAPKRPWSDEAERLWTVDYLLRKKTEEVATISLMFRDKVVVTYPPPKERM